MALATKRDARAARKRRDQLALLSVLLFPMLVASGFLAPGWVRVFATAQEAELGPREPLVDRIGPLSRRPLPAPREFFGGGAPELLDLDKLFASSTLGDPLAGAGATGATGSFPRVNSDMIVLDDVGNDPPDIDFKDALVPDPMQVAGDDEDEGLLPVCGTGPFGNCVRDDDFTGNRLEITIVPEPGTGALLALGLAGLALRRRAA